MFYPRCYASISILFSLIPYKHDFNIILFHGISSSNSILKCIAMDQWEQMFAPLRILRDLSFEMPSSGFVQPFKIIHWSLRLLFLSFRGELFNRRRTNNSISLGTPCHCRMPPPVFICSRCSGCNMDLSPYALSPDIVSVRSLKRLAVDCIQTGCSIILQYRYFISFGFNPSNQYQHLRSYHNLHSLLSDLMVTYGLDDR